MSLPVLPLDVFDEIFSQLTDKTSVETLKSCSLVCRAFRRRAQKILFRSIAVVLLNNDDDYNDSELDYSACEPINLILIIDGAPHLIEYIQDLTINGDLIRDPMPDDDYATDLADALGIFSHKGESFPIDLRSLYLEELSWHYIPSRLQDALVLLKAVPSLRDITLQDLMNCPANLVQDLPPLLEYLSMSYTTFLSLPTTRNEPPKLESFKITGLQLSQFLDAMDRIVDLTQLKTFNADVDKNTVPLIEQILQPTSNSLEHLRLRFEITDPDPVPINLEWFSHLTDITIDIFCYVARTVSLIPSTFILITGTMKKISHRNVIQNLSLYLFLSRNVDMVDVESVMKDGWQELDTICFIPQLTLSNSFRGITFIIESTAINCDAFSVLVQHKLAGTKKANKLHILKRRQGLVMR